MSARRRGSAPDSHPCLCSVPRSTAAGRWLASRSARVRANGIYEPSQRDDRGRVADALGAEVPAGRRGQRDRHLRDADARELVAVVVDLRHEKRERRSGGFDQRADRSDPATPGSEACRAAVREPVAQRRVRRWRARACPSSPIDARRGSSARMTSRCGHRDCGSCLALAWRTAETPLRRAACRRADSCGRCRAASRSRVPSIAVCVSAAARPCPQYSTGVFV